MKHLWLPIGLSLVMSYATSNSVMAADKYKNLSDTRIKEIAGWLDDQPKGLSTPCSDRDVWSRVNAIQAGDIVPAAKWTVKQPFPAWSDDAYKQYWEGGGVRFPGVSMMESRTNRLTLLVVAECIDNKGFFIDEIKRNVLEIAKQPSWVYAFDDKGYVNFKDKKWTIDLLAAHTAHNIALALNMFGDSFTKEEYDIAYGALDQRIFKPMLAALVVGKDEPNHWLLSVGNWNAYCLNGVVGAALAVVKSKEERAAYIAAAEYYAAKYYLESFSADGYTPEGPHYWDYGFAKFAQLRENLTIATKGRIDLFSKPKSFNASQYSFKIEMMPNSVAKFGDVAGGLHGGFEKFTRAYVNKAYGFGYPYKLNEFKLNKRDIGEAVIAAKAELYKERPPIADFPYSSLSSIFSDAGVFVSRPELVNDHLGVTIKASSNAGHVHDDMGSYSIAIDNFQVVGDVGGPNVYSSKTFNATQRPTIPSVNSWGHPVPVVAKQLQKRASDIHTYLAKSQPPLGMSALVPPNKIIQSTLQDSVTINMAYAYNVPTLKTLNRIMTHTRGKTDKNTVEIKDIFEFTPNSKYYEFESAVTTTGSCIFDPADRSMTLTVPYLEGNVQKSKSVRMVVEASAPWTYQVIDSNEESTPFKRLAFSLTKPSKSGYIKWTFTDVTNKPLLSKRLC